MAQFVAYIFNPDDMDEATPIAMGATREEALKKGLLRNMKSGACCDMVVRQRDDIDADVFRQGAEELDQYFAEKGIE